MNSKAILIVLNPYWIVLLGIARRGFIPKAMRDPSLQQVAPRKMF